MKKLTVVGEIRSSYLKRRRRRARPVGEELASGRYAYEGAYCEIFLSIQNNVHVRGFGPLIVHPD